MPSTWNMWSWVVLVVAWWLGGCGADSSKFTTSLRPQDGLVVILPGIEGEGPLSYAVAKACPTAGWTTA